MSYHNCLNDFSRECKELLHYHLRVPEISENEVLLDSFPLVFHREYVAKNMPVLIKNGCKHFAAYEKWNSDYLLKKFGDELITVAITPNGYADGIAKVPETEEEVFILPEERQMKMAEFLENLDNPKENYICYIQKQNSNLTDEEFKGISNDVDLDISWATKAFNKQPDAVNFWMGDSRAITSMHKDPYENIYCVLHGTKQFLLIPPTDLPFIPYSNYPVGTYRHVSPSCSSYQVDIQRQSDPISWISVDPLRPDYQRHPQFHQANVYQVTVERGDCLYLPSLWFHHVRQSHGCIALNYWYDMDYDVRYCYYKLLEALCKANNKTSD